MRLWGWVPKIFCQKPLTPSGLGVHFGTRLQNFYEFGVGPKFFCQKPLTPGGVSVRFGVGA